MNRETDPYERPLAILFIAGALAVLFVVGVLAARGCGGW